MTQDSDGFSNIAMALRLRWWIVVLTIVVGLAVGTLVTARQAKTYTASATVLLNQSNTLQELFGPVAAQADPTRLAQTDLSLAQSPAFQDSAARRLRLSVSDVQNDSSVSAGTESDVLTFTGTSTSPDRSARIANGLSTAFVSFSDRVASQNVASAEAGLRVQLAGLAARISLSSTQRNSLRRTLQQRLSEATALAGVGTSGTQIGSLASIPTSPSSPSVAKSAVLGGGVGLILGIALILLLAQTDRRLGSISQVAETYELPVIGAVPDSDDLRSGRPFEALDDIPREAFERIATRIMHMLPTDGTNGTIVLLTSAEAGYGKTTLVRQLSAAMATFGKVTLAVDADLRRPGLSRACGLAASQQGLRSAIEQRDVYEAFSAIRPIAVDDSDAPSVSYGLCPAGPASPHPGALLASRAVGDIFDALRVGRDYVFVDSGPLAAASESLALLAHADAVVVVSRVGSDNVAAAHGMMSELHGFDARTVGIIANRAPAGVLPYGYGAQPTVG